MKSWRGLSFHFSPSSRCVQFYALHFLPQTLPAMLHASFLAILFFGVPHVYVLPLLDLLMFCFNPSSSPFRSGRWLFVRRRHAITLHIIHYVALYIVTHYMMNRSDPVRLQGLADRLSALAKRHRALAFLHVKPGRVITSVLGEAGRGSEGKI
jgi:hypothetical protein